MIFQILTHKHILDGRSPATKLQFGMALRNQDSGHILRFQTPEGLCTVTHPITILKSIQDPTTPKAQNIILMTIKFM